jgi:hypothetical protein
MDRLFIVIVIAAVLSVGCNAVEALSTRTQQPTGEVGALLACTCSPEVTDPDIGGCLDNDADGDCICLHEDKCPGEPHCDSRLDTDGDGRGDVCDELPNTPNPESAIADLEARIDVLEALVQTP